MDKIIHKSAVLSCSPERAFEIFTVNEELVKWLTVIADVEPKVGGKYELIWNPEEREYDSTIGCKITTIEKDKFLSFEWKGPKQFSDFMNTVDPLTHVVVFFIPLDDGKIEVHLIHSGWRDTPDWDSAREWFEVMWGSCFEELEKLINK